MRKAIPLAVSGLLMIFTGAYMILRPDGFLSVVIAMLGLYIAFDGIRSAVSLIRFRTFFPGAVKTANPSILLDIVIYIVAADFLATALINFIDCMILSRSGVYYGSLGLEAVLSFISSIVLFLFPGFIGSVVMTLLAAVILASGAVMVYAAVMYFIGKDGNGGF